MRQQAGRWAAVILTWGIAACPLLLAGCGGQRGEKYVEPANPVPLPKSVPMVPSTEGRVVELPKNSG